MPLSKLTVINYSIDQFTVNVCSVFFIWWVNFKASKQFLIVTDQFPKCQESRRKNACLRRIHTNYFHRRVLSLPWHPKTHIFEENPKFNCFLSFTLKQQHNSVKRKQLCSPSSPATFHLMSWKDSFGRIRC